MKFSLSIGKTSVNFSTERAEKLAAQTADARRLASRETTDRPTQSGGSRMYDAARVNRLTSDVPITITSANAEILVSQIAMRSLNRTLDRDVDYFRKIMRLFENNVIGHRGITLKKVKAADGSYDEAVSNKVKLAWKEFLKKENFTVMGTLSGVDLQKLCVRAWKRDGQILFRKHYGPRYPFGIAFQPIECDRLDHWWNRPAVGSANEIQFGVEMDDLRKPLAYWILTRHPGDVFAWSSGPKYRERVPAEDIVIIQSIDRAEQIVGVTDLCAIPKRLNMLSKYEEAEAVAARMGAAKAGFFEKKDTAGQYAGPQDGAGNKNVELSPGQLEELPVGWEFKPYDPTHPTDAYPDFTKQQLRGAASGAGLSYVDVANDLEGVSFSSIRQGTLEQREQYKGDQEFLKVHLMDELFSAWLPFAIMSGKLNLSISQIEKFNQPVWQGRRWAWVDPLKDVQASLLELGGNLTSLRRIVSEDEEGGDIQEIFEEIKQDQELADKIGIELNPQPETQKIASEEENSGGPEKNGKPNGAPKRNGHGRWGFLEALMDFSRLRDDDGRHNGEQ